MGDEQIKGVETILRKKLGSLPVVLSSKPCIYKAPKHILKVSEECYRPSIMSIGPIYYKDPSLEAMEELKLRHLQCFLDYGKNPYTLEDYLNYVRGWEDEARACYAEKITLSSNEFIEMVLIDATFIIFFLFSYNLSLKNHPTKDKMVEVFSLVERDLFLEENQLPFFILNNLYDLAFGINTYYSDISFIDLTCTFIDNRFMCGRYATNASTISKRIREGATIKHLVDFVRIYFILPSRASAPRRQLLYTNSSHTSLDDPQFPLSVTELSAAGVRFAASKSRSLLDIRFINGVLHIPRFIVQDSTEPLFRSLLLYEQCHCYFDSHFIDYIYFLFNLIKSPNDVRILVKNEIITSWLASDEEVANMFMGIINRVPINLRNFYYSTIAKDLNAYATTRWHRWKGILKKEYFNHPWAITSVIYAIVLLFLTLLQTISGFTSNRN